MLMYFDFVYSGFVKLSAELINKVLFTDGYTWQNFRVRLLRLVNRLYAVIHKTQKS